MDKKFEINRTKIWGSCQSGRKVVTHDSKSDLSLIEHVNKKIHVCTTTFCIILFIQIRLSTK